MEITAKVQEQWSIRGSNNDALCKSTFTYLPWVWSGN